MVVLVVEKSIEFYLAGVTNAVDPEEVWRVHCLVQILIFNIFIIYWRYSGKFFYYCAKAN